MKKNHVNIPVFIPHLGCPNMCVFCNQRAISGVSSFIPDMAEETIETALSSLDGMADRTEIAFFGGSFTGIDRELMVSLLDLAESYVEDGRVSGIRMSTRPDYIDGEIISILKNYTVKAVELGIQSTSDKVLAASKRGHTSECSFRAMTMLRDAGFTTVGQMMIGLPLSTREDEVKTAEDICSLGASGSRIYPTIVFRDTELYDMTQRGEYVPLTVEDAALRSADVLEVFVGNGVECIRIGLCDSENLHSDKTYFAGPNHPALGEMIIGEVFYKNLRRAMEKHENTDSITVRVPCGAVSAAVGQKKRNKIRLADEYGVRRIKFVEDSSLTGYNVRIENN